MTYEAFLKLDLEEADRLPAALCALALDRAGKWAAAHDRAASVETLETSRVHAYLHRKEGDLANARYWYARVGEPMPDEGVEVEWSALVRRFVEVD